ncbi:hypothetical protein ACIG0C_02425 [Kitasatospora aureofaciens]|uniref:Uncharacterized protein n=2 Tax=Kitasatospora TaxID=2063 RepID=A0A1E7N3D0_KITAU|nr:MULTISPECIES: hypothetical protein [Kitasatospora]QEV00469.1 hypothetical protein CP971_15345 [Streptomyces viridifaciens]ARF79269.1 hypothetical protein B6264_10375 [Kitasatospora aureofaciens]OEV35209.1 hypothetical protein HS99_0033345 [Kitasatospora aureofaciens]UKZ06714.1 hypothetical protein BOQ63_022245 [Streptomyces viridifaciens]WBP87631.1 hypothetical protein O1G21_18465 [Kitasatospora sp. HUAS 3-15]
MHPKVKIFITIFCYISAVAGLVTAVMDASQKPADTTSAVVAGVLGVAFLLGGLALTRKPRY